MPTLDWTEIKQRSIQFSKRWIGIANERAESQTFWNDFFAVFGRERRAVAIFENAVKKISGATGHIDLFWKGTLLVEHKSLGKPLDKAESQAFDYLQGLVKENRIDELPRYVILSDFARFALYDLEADLPKDEIHPEFGGRTYKRIEFSLQDLHKHIRHFGFIAGYQKRRLDPEDPANEKATRLMCGLHDALEAGGYPPHDLKRFLVRLLFCFFAEDTGVFPPNAFEDFLENQTQADGSDLGSQINHLFRILDTPTVERQTNLGPALKEFPYVNGELFRERLDFAEFDVNMRNHLLACCRFHWQKISPAVFGSLFQAVMEPKERRQIGAHYTSERDIMKLVRSLFLDELYAEFELIKSDASTRKQSRLEAFQQKLGSLRFLDPACGCGNFLVLSYRELRKLELQVLIEIHRSEEGMLQQHFSLDDINRLSIIDVDQMAGIEIEEFPARIAEVALWLMDHCANQEVSAEFGQNYQRIPLKKHPRIVVGNALRMDWNNIIPATECSYILGNPPFVGKHYQNPEQRNDMKFVFTGSHNTGDLDYVACWYRKAAEFIQDTKIKAAFVSTNSITQGEQVPILWSIMFLQFKIKILFAHRPFKWQSESRGKAHVHVVIIGFSNFDTDCKKIFDYDVNKKDSYCVKVKNISPYLTDGSDTFVTKRTKPIYSVPEMRCGNKPSDGGNLILSTSEKEDLLRAEPDASEFIHRFIGSEEFINGKDRWCIWLDGISPMRLKQLPHVMKRIEAVKNFRLSSSATPTQKSAATPYLFFYRNQPATNYIVIPEVSSERRDYIPIGIVPHDIISANTNFLIHSDDRYFWGILISAMHMAWMRIIGGRLESRYRYSGSMVYNNFPWPKDISDEKKDNIRKLAQIILNIREKHFNTDTGSCLADLYDPLTMPQDLLKAHQELDRAVEKCYRKEKFNNDRERVEFLFAEYERLTTPLKLWDIKSAFHGKHYINHAYLLEFLKNVTGSEIDKKTLNRYLVDWKREGLLYEAGRGWYSDLKETFKLDIEPLRHLHEVMAEKFPLIDFACWSTAQIAPYHHHLPGKFITFVYADRPAMKDVATILSNEFPESQVVANPLGKAAEEFSKRDINIIVRPLRSSDLCGSVAGSYFQIENILVNLAIESELLNIMDQEEFRCVAENIVSSGRVNPGAMTTIIDKRQLENSGYIQKINQLIPDFIKNRN